MHQRLEDAIDAGLGDLGLLIDVFQGDRSMVLLQLLDHVKSLGKNGDQIKPFNLRLGQSFASLSSIPSSSCSTVRLNNAKSVPLQQVSNDLRIKRHIPERGAESWPGNNHGISYRQYLSIASPSLHCKGASAC
jgi:hypothetical protein